jgi:hypothetical protein
MTTPSTPAGWYPDPDGSGGQRYWDGFAWTEHHSPAVAAPAPAEEPADEFPASEQATSVVSLPDQPTTVVRRQSAPPPTPEPEEPRAAGAHRAPDPEPVPVTPPVPPVPPAAPVAPSFDAPSTPSYEPPPAPSYEAPSYETPTYEAPSAEAPSYAAPSSEAPFYEAPTFETPSYEAPTYATPSYDAPPATAPSAFSGPPEPPQPPVASDGSDGPGGGPDNRKLIIGFLSAVGGLLLVLMLVLVYAFVIRDDHKSEIAIGTSTSATTTTTSSQSSATETESETATASPTPPIGPVATEGDFAFSVASTDSGDTVTSPINEYIEKTATGEFIVVYLNVGNTGTGPLTFLSTLQVLNTNTGTFGPDDEASFYLGGGVVTINPGEQVETAVAFDVPVGAAPVSILVHGEPGGAGVDLPLS